MARRALRVSLEDIDKPLDGLEVTNAIDIVESTTQVDDPDDLTTKSEQVHEQQKKLDENDTDDMGDGLDGGSVDGGGDDDEINPEDADPEDDEGEEESDGEEAEESDDPDEQEIQDVQDTVEDAKTLEALVEIYNTNQYTLESHNPRRDRRLAKLANQVRNRSRSRLHSLLNRSGGFALEADSFFAKVKAKVIEIWDRLMAFIGRMIETFGHYRDIQKSKAASSKHDLDKLGKVIDDIDPSWKPTTQEIENTELASYLTTTPNKNDATEMISSLTKVTETLNQFFDGGKSKLNEYIQSVNTLLDIKDSFPTELSGNLVASNKTLPKFMVKATDVPWRKKPTFDQVAYLGPLMPKGYRYAAYAVSKTEVHFGGDQDRGQVLQSWVGIDRDPSYQTDTTSLPVMKLNEMGKLLGILNKLRNTLIVGEGYAMHIHSTLKSFEQEVSMKQKQAHAMASHPSASIIEEQTKSMRLVGTTLASCMVLANSFFGKVATDSMVYGNAIMSAGIKYLTQSTNAYLKPQKREPGNQDSD